LAAIARGLCLRTMYIFRSDNQLEIPISLSSFKGMAEEIMLVDSGATENFID